jgi:hypothetical protein
MARRRKEHRVPLAGLRASSRAPIGQPVLTARAADLIGARGHAIADLFQLRFRLKT